MPSSVHYTVYQNVVRELPDYRKFKILDPIIDEKQFEDTISIRKMIRINAKYEKQNTYNIFSQYPGERNLAIFIFTNNASQLYESEVSRRWVDRVNRNKDIDDVLIIHEGEIKSNVHKRLIELQKRHVETRPFANFVFCVPKHVCVVPHMFATPDEVDKLIKQNIDIEDNIPHILDSDPPIVWIGARNGDIVRIDRVSESTLVSSIFKIVRQDII